MASPPRDRKARRDHHRRHPGTRLLVTDTLGSRARYLRANGVSHPRHLGARTIGTEASPGCIRMIHEGIIDLYDRAPLGASVIVT